MLYQSPGTTCCHQLLQAWWCHGTEVANHSPFQRLEVEVRISEGLCALCRLQGRIPSPSSWLVQAGLGRPWLVPYLLLPACFSWWVSLPVYLNLFILYLKTMLNTWFRSHPHSEGWMMGHICKWGLIVRSRLGPNVLVDALKPMHMSSFEIILWTLWTGCLSEAIPSEDRAHMQCSLHPIARIWYNVHCNSELSKYSLNK